jgi:uncharacterized protein (TIGR02145 family)
MKSATAVNGQADGTSKGLAAGGFDALLMGYMYGNTVNGYGTTMHFWSSSSINSSDAWYRFLAYGVTGVQREEGSKYCMRSVRCKKNDN